MAEVITDPLSWPPLPCLNPDKVQVDRVLKDGESWQWHEFKLTAYHFPGQTLYHGGLLAESGDLRILFVGDSLTAGGIEDYCAFNRNLLGPGLGYDRCMELVEKLNPTHILYAHRAESFAYTAEDCRFMRANLSERLQCHPYEQHVKAGTDVSFDVVISNHSTQTRAAACRANPPRSWGMPALAPASLASEGWSKGDIEAKADGKVHLSLTIPKGVKPGKYFIPVDLRYGSRVLPQFGVAMLIVG